MAASMVHGSALTYADSVGAGHNEVEVRCDDAQDET